MAKASSAPCGAANYGLALGSRPLPTDSAPLHVEPIGPPAPPLLVQLKTQGGANLTRQGSEMSSLSRADVVLSSAANSET